MTIITVPHPTLRQQAKPVAEPTKKIKTLLRDLAITLEQKRNPRGVGLAAPQVDERYRIFATNLPLSGKRNDGEPLLRLFINPTIADWSSTLTFGPNPEEPILEGCLSIPGIYGPVPRHEWVEVQFDELQGDTFVTKTERFSDFHARVIQHEYDHLDGKLFIDYAAQLDLPLYQERGKKMDEMSTEMVKAFYDNTR